MSVANLNKKCFAIWSNEFEGRLDPYFYKAEFRNQIAELSQGKFKVLRFRDICLQITDGTHFTPHYVNDGVPFLSVKNIRENKISFDDTKFITGEEHNTLIKRCEPKTGDVLLTKVGTIGLSAVITDKMPEFSIFVSVALLKINNDLANPFYVSAFLNSKYARFQMKRIVKGIGVPDLHLESISEMKIPIPPMGTQNKIVEIIQAAYDGKVSKEQEAANILNSIDDFILQELEVKLPETKDYKCFCVKSGEIENNRIDPYYSQPKFETILTLIDKSKYPVKLLKNIAEKIISGQRPKGGVSQIKQGIPSLGGEHILSNGLIKTTGLKFIPVEYHNQHIENKIQKKDILIVKDGATTGKVGIIPENYPYEEANINEHLFLIRYDGNAVNPYFLMAFLKSFLGQTQIERNITGATITGIIRETIEKVKIILPPMGTQKKMADTVKERINQAEKLKTEAKNEIENAKAEVEKIILGV